jgi:transposase
VAVAVATDQKDKGKDPAVRQGTVLEVLPELLAAGQHEEVIALVQKLVCRNHELERLLAKLREGNNRGEHISKAQLVLCLQGLVAPSDEALAEANRTLEQTTNEHAGRPERTKPPRQPAVRRKPSPALVRVDNPIVVPDTERPCPVCGTLRRCIAHETTEVIDLIPAQVIVRRDIREVLACQACDAELVRAPLGDKVIEAGAYGSRLVADLVVSKYQDGLPLHRKGQILERLGLSMPSSSMSDQITWATDLLRPIWRALQNVVLYATVLHTDSTSLPVRDRQGPKGIVTGALWGYVGDQDAAVYLYTSTGKKLGQRDGELGPEQFLKQREGPIVADATNLLDKTFADPRRIEVGCNMHARRYFVKALEAGDTRAAVPLSAFQALYDVEEVARPLDPQGRLGERQRRSRPVYDELLRWARTYQGAEPPASLLGKALQYLLNHQVALTRFLDDGRLPIDNGIVERLHRRPAITRRNFLFAGSHAAGERAAIAYSILATCTLLDINPIEYLADVLPRLARGIVVARDVPALLPAAWKAARASSASPTP